MCNLVGWWLINRTGGIEVPTYIKKFKFKIYIIGKLVRTDMYIFVKVGLFLFLIKLYVVTCEWNGRINAAAACYIYRGYTVDKVTNECAMHVACTVYVLHTKIYNTSNKYTWYFNLFTVPYVSVNWTLGYSSKRLRYHDKMKVISVCVCVCDFLLKYKVNRAYDKFQ